MSPPVRQRLTWLALLLVPFGLYGWALVVATGAGYNGKIGPAFNGLAADWTIFYTAIEAWRHGHLDQIYDQVWLGRQMQGAYKPWLINPEPYPAFHYPPTWLLFLAPFAGLSMIASFAATQALAFAALIGALARTYGQKLQTFSVYVSAMVLAPAASNNVLSGQNGVLICALFVAGVSILETQPILAGALLGLASFKPQILLMAPFALIGGRHWRAIAGGVGSALALAVLSAVAFGPQIWMTWFNLMLHPRHDVAITGIEWGRLWDDSVYTCAQLWGLDKTAANVVQALATLTAGGLVYVAFRRPLATDLKLAVFLAASVVAAPHVSGYDLILLTMSGVICGWRAVADGGRPLAYLLPIAAWLGVLFTPPRVNPLGFSLPVICFGLIFTVLWSGARGRQDAGASGLALAGD